MRTSNSKVVCCHFSSDGKLLASAGHEKKVFRMAFCNVVSGSVNFDMSADYWIRECLNHGFHLGTCISSYWL